MSNPEKVFLRRPQTHSPELMIMGGRERSAEEFVVPRRQKITKSRQIDLVEACGTAGLVSAGNTSPHQPQ